MSARRTVGWRVRWEERYFGADLGRGVRDGAWHFVRDDLRTKREDAVEDLRWVATYKQEQRGKTHQERPFRIRNVRLVRVTRPARSLAPTAPGAR